MKNCPYCSEEIQDTAKKCRFCGEWFSEGIEKNENSNNITNTNKPGFLKRSWYLIMGWLLVITGLGQIGNNESTPESGAYVFSGIIVIIFSYLYKSAKYRKENPSLQHTVRKIIEGIGCTLGVLIILFPYLRLTPIELSTRLNEQALFYLFMPLFCVVNYIKINFFYHTTEYKKIFSKRWFWTACALILSIIIARALSLFL